jgi:PAS domain-containing protein
MTVDIDAGKKAEDQSGYVAQLQATLNVIPAHTWYASPSGGPTFVNKRTADYLGLPKDHPLRFGIDVGARLDAHLPCMCYAVSQSFRPGIAFPGKPSSRSNRECRRCRSSGRTRPSRIRGRKLGTTHGSSLRRAAVCRSLLSVFVKILSPRSRAELSTGCGA